MSQILNRQTMSGAPISTPFSERGGANTEPWIQWFTKASAFFQDAHNIATATDTSGAETCKYLRVGPVILYSYTGLGGVTFNLRGNAVTIPTTTTSTMMNSFIFAGE